MNEPPRDIRSTVIDLQAVFESKQRSNTSDLKGHGGGGNSGDMEARLARLESDMEHVKRSLDKIDRDLGATKGDISSLKTAFAVFEVKLAEKPGKGFIIASTATIIAVLAAVIAIAVRFIPAVG